MRLVCLALLVLSVPASAQGQFVRACVASAEAEGVGDGAVVCGCAADRIVSGGMDPFDLDALTYYVDAEGQFDTSAAPAPVQERGLAMAGALVACLGELGIDLSAVAEAPPSARPAAPPAARPVAPPAAPTERVAELVSAQRAPAVAEARPAKPAPERVGARPVRPGADPVPSVRAQATPAPSAASSIARDLAARPAAQAAARARAMADAAPLAEPAAVAEPVAASGRTPIVLPATPPARPTLSGTYTGPLPVREAQPVPAAMSDDASDVADAPADADRQPDAATPAAPLRTGNGTAPVRTQQGGAGAAIRIVG